MSFKTPDQLWTKESFGTLAGAAAIAWFVTSALGKAFDVNLTMWALIASIVVALAGAFLAPGKEAAKYVVAFFNGFLIYLIVLGGTSFAPAGNIVPPSQPSKPKFIRPFNPDKNLTKAIQDAADLNQAKEAEIQKLRIQKQALDSSRQALQNTSADINQLRNIVTHLPSLTNSQRQTINDVLARMQNRIIKE